MIIIMIYPNNFDEIINNYIEKCNQEEWGELLNEYNIDNTENYMGEVRQNLEETIKEIYNSLSYKEQIKMLNFFSKYEDIEKDNTL